MIGNGQWATTRDEESVKYFLADIKMRRDLVEERRQARREFWCWLRSRTRRTAHRGA